MPVRRTLLVLLLCASTGWAAELKTLKQETITGDLVRISSKEIVLKAASGDVTTPIDQVLTLTFGQQTGPLPSNLAWVDVELTDGTELHCATFSVKKTQVEVTLLAGQKVTFPLSSPVVDADQRPAGEEPQGVGRHARQDLALPRRGGPGHRRRAERGRGPDRRRRRVRRDHPLHAVERPGGRALALAKIFGMAFSRKPTPTPPSCSAACRTRTTTSSW